MPIDPKDLRRYYESLNDDGLLDIDRADLTPVAQGIYDQEIARRGLRRPSEPTDDVDEVEPYHRPLPVMKTAANWDFANELGADTGDGPPPAWLRTQPAPGPRTFTRMPITSVRERRFRPLCGKREFRVESW